MDINIELPYKVKMINKNKTEEMLNFSIVIITKNDEDNITQLLESLTEYSSIGEICILDLGSTDNTISIAQQYKCKIEDGSFIIPIDDETVEYLNNYLYDDIIKKDYTYKDLSNIRNYAASLASNDMILMIDSNFKIINFNISEIYDIINENNYDLINFEVQNKFKHTLSFYNRTKFNWENIVYESLIAIEEVKDIFTQHLTLQSLGSKEFSDSTEILTAISLNSYLKPDNLHLQNKLILELINNNYVDSAYIKINENSSNLTKEEKCIFTVEIADKLLIDNEDKAIEFYQKAYNNCDTLRVPLYNLGKHYYIKKDWKRCILYLEGCLNIEKTDNVPENDFMYLDGPYSMLYVAYWWIGNPKKGKYYFDKAIEIDPFNELYVNEAIYHYKYKGNTIPGHESFQQLQYLYNNSKKYESILEIYPESRSTHAIINGCDGLVTVIRNNDCNCYLESLDFPGNINVIHDNINNIISDFNKNNTKFDMIILHNLDILLNDIDDKYWSLRIWEKFTNKLLCGVNYTNNKEIIDKTMEISGVDNDIWYMNISSFEKTTILKKKE